MKEDIKPDPLPLELLAHITKTMQGAYSFIDQRAYGSDLYFKTKEAYETLKKLTEEKSKDIPNWYSLYEGMIGKYVVQRHEVRELRKEYNSLKLTLKNLREKYFDLAKRLDPKNEECEKI